MTQPRKIGFRTSRDEEELEPMKQLNNAEEAAETDENSPTVMLEDYIPGAVYDGNGNIVTFQSFNAKVKKLKAETRNLNWTAIARLILYTSLGASVLLLSYGAYNKYFKDYKAKQTIVCPQKER